jgi:hypothetical protein
MPNNDTVSIAVTAGPISVHVDWRISPSSGCGES